MGIFDVLRHSWDVFRNREPTYYNIGSSNTYRPDRIRTFIRNEQSIVTSIYTRIALDVASINIRHCRVDENGRFKEYISSGLDNCLNLEANIDQTGRAFKQDIVESMFDEGVVAMVPVDTTIDPTVTGSYDIQTMRTGKILEWYPEHVKVQLYNQKTGYREELILPKRIVGIIENPMYSIINEPNSTMQRLIRKLTLLDRVDETTSSGKLDMIIQLPYVIKSDSRRKEAEKRKKDIEEQLKGPYGIAYVDGTEKIIQLNRPVENNLMKQVEYLRNELYSQLGITQEVLNGTADEQTMLNYNSRTIEPIVSAITDEMTRKFLTKTARSQSQTIMFFRDPFRLVPVNNIAEIADKFTRNEILTSNEIRGVIGFKPSDDPKADKLINSNLNQPDGEQTDRTIENEPGEPIPETSIGDMPISTLSENDN